jgi:hypothetical protein
MENWPPLMCPACWAMKFVTNTYMAQCMYCGRVFMNWGRHAHPGSAVRYFGTRKKV